MNADHAREIVEACSALHLPRTIIPSRADREGCKIKVGKILIVLNNIVLIIKMINSYPKTKVLTINRINMVNNPYKLC